MKCTECGRTETAKWYSPKTNPTCASCYRRKYVAANRDKVATYLKEYNSSDRARAARKSYEATQKGKIARKKADKAYYERNPDKMKAKRDTDQQRKRLKDHYAANKPYYHEKSTRRRRNMDMASLGGKYREETIEMYAKCPEGHEVDHIVPLKGKEVCGLHVPWNLQHLSKSENRKKSNKIQTPYSVEPKKRIQ